MSEILDKARLSLGDELNFKPIHNEKTKPIRQALNKLEQMEQRFEVGAKPVKRDIVKVGIMNKVFGIKQLYRCPVCSNCLLEKYANERQLNNHCWDCGIKLDWSDVE